MVELDADLRDPGIGEAGEHHARLIDGNSGPVRGVFVDGGAQRRVQHRLWVFAVYLLRDGVVAHQVGRAPRGIARQAHQGRQIGTPVDESPAWPMHRRPPRSPANGRRGRGSRRGASIQFRFSVLVAGSERLVPLSGVQGQPYHPVRK